MGSVVSVRFAGVDSLVRQGRQGRVQAYQRPGGNRSHERSIQGLVCPQSVSDPGRRFLRVGEAQSGGKLPHFLHHADGAPLALAGLWGSWKNPEGERVTTCTIITTRPNHLVSSIHDRMPVILPKETWNRWLDRENSDIAALTALLQPAADGTLTEYPVSTLVNDVKNNYAECAAPLR